MTEYQLFPDIKLIVGAPEEGTADDLIEISFCTGGVCEYNIGGRFLYLGTDCCIIFPHGTYDICHCTHSPDYCGITLLIDPRYNGETFSGILDITDIQRKMQCRDGRIFCATDNIKKLFSEIYAESEGARKSILRLRTLELLMVLGEGNAPCSRQENTLKKVREFICKNISEHYTIAELSRLFAMNPTALKSGFKEHFGCTLYDYAKKKKMFYAAELLRGTDMRVIDVAEEVGYSNASKFSRAFSSVMGVTPKSFQMERKKLVCH